MAEKSPIPSEKEKYDALLKEIRTQKSMSSLEKIYEDLKQNKSSLYDNNKIPFQFSNDLLWLLQYNLIKIDTQLDIYKLYIDEFFDMKAKPEELSKTQFLFHIFNYESNFYRNSSNIENFIVFLNRFFNIYYPKNMSIEHEVGDIMDVFVSDENFKINLFGWIQMPIKRIDKEKNLYIFEDYKDTNKEVMIAIDSFKVQEKNTFVKEEEIIWRNNLKLGDKVDYLSSNKNWVEGTIKIINSNGEFKIYSLDEIVQNEVFLKKYSPFIQPYLKYSFKYEPDEANGITLLGKNDEFLKFNYFIPTTETNFCIPREELKYYSLEYYEMINYFIKKIFTTRILENESLPIEYIFNILSTLYAFSRFINQKYFSKYFYEKCFENLKKILLDYSLNKKQNIPKLIVENIFTFIDFILGQNFYPFQLTKILPNLMINFGYNCFKTSEKLEKRLLGLTSISKILAILINFFPIISNNVLTEITSLISEKLLGGSGDNDFFGILFDNNIHQQLLLKGIEIILTLSKLKLLDDKDIDRLYNLAISTQVDSDIYQPLYGLLVNIAKEMTLSQLKIIFDKIISLPYDKIREMDIELMKNILQNIKSEEDLKNMSKSFLDYYYNYMVIYKNKDTAYGKDFGIIMSYSKYKDTLYYLYTYYFEKIINEINNQNDLEGYRYYFTLIHSIFHSFDNLKVPQVNDRKARSLAIEKLSKIIQKKIKNENRGPPKEEEKEEKIIINKSQNDELIFIKNKLKEIFFANFKDFGEIVDKLLFLNNKEEKESNEEYINDVIDIVNGFTDFVDGYKFYTVDSLMKLADYFVFTTVIRKKRNHFLYNILNMKKIEFDKNALYECLFQKIDNFLDSITIDMPEIKSILTDNFANVIFLLFKEINKNPKIIVDPMSDEEIYHNEVIRKTEKINPLEYKYFDIVWKMFLKYNDHKGIKEFLESFSLKNFSPKERHEIWEKIVKKIFEDLESNVFTCLKMIEYILKFSEEYGSGGAISHLAETKKKNKINLNLMQEISFVIKPFNNEKNLDLTSISTLYDLKKCVQKKFGIDPIFIDFSIPNRNEKLSDSNAKPLFKIFPKLLEFSDEKISLLMKRSRILNTSVLYPLMNEDKTGLTDKFLEVLKEIFNRYSKDDKLDITNFKIYYNHSQNLNSNSTSKESEAIAEFHKYDIGNKGYLTCDDFIIFYGNECQTKGDFIGHILVNLGYTKSLDYYLAPLKKDSIFYYEENNVKEYMPRYFIGNNKEYMSKLFKYAKDENKFIHELAQNLLKELCSMEEMKKTIFENNDKIDQILSNNNLELRAYAYDVLLSEFEKNDEEKNETTQNLTNNFIYNNLDKLIIELDKFIKKDEKPENKENNKVEENASKQQNEFKISLFFNYYLSNLKILYYAFKNIANNKELITYIDKFEDLEDENEKNNIKNIKIELNEEKQNLIIKLDMQKLINIIGKNFTLLEKNNSPLYRSGIRLSLKLLIYIILFSRNLPEKENVYKEFFIYQIKFVLESKFYTKRNIFIMNKLILPFMNEENDKKYINIEYEVLSKEVKDYTKLNNFGGKLLFFFRLFNDLLDLSIKDSQNDQLFKFFEELLELILNKNVILNEHILTGYLGIIKRILTILKESKFQKFYEYDFESLISTLINDFIITFDKDENNKIIEVEKLKKYSKYSGQDYVSNIYQIIDIIIPLNQEKYLKIFFENEEIKNVIEKHLTKLEDEKNSYSPIKESVSSTGFVGLKNLSCLCYINSVIQQFFMIPLFQNAILSLPLDPSLKEEDDNDNLLFQLEKMFYYLKNSKKEYYNPQFFVFSFKDYDGNPTNINVQCDAQEFLSRLIEKIEENLRGTPQKYLCGNIFGGSTLQQVKCTNPECGNISERRENINYLSLDIKSSHNVIECLDKFIIDEKIEDYHCEKCDKKITNIKNVLIDKIPNILIIHLQRIAFSYETFNMEKINSIITFEQNLNIKKYTINKDNNNIPSEYFDYELHGVLIHSGTAQYGHYYSIISRDKDVKSENWCKFNDTVVSESNFDKIDTEGFGSHAEHDYGSSAYMLIYQKKIKKPVIINNKEINETVKKILDENTDKNLEKIELPEGKIYYIYENEKDAVEKNIIYNKEENKNNIQNIDKNIIIKNSETEANLVAYEEALDLLEKKNNENINDKPFINTIFLENIRLCNDKKFFSKAFTEYMEGISAKIKKEILEDKTNTKINTYIPILKTINNFMLNILAKSEYKDKLNIIVDNITDIYNHSVPKEFISYLIKEIIEPIKEKLYQFYFVSRDRIMGNDISKYIGRIICCGINNNIETELSMKIIQFYIDKIPVEITKKWIDMEAFNNLIMTFIENSDIVKKAFLHNNMISKLIDFILGKSSPLYQGDDRIENRNNRGNFGPIVKSIALLFKYYADNYEKEQLKISASDLKLINHNHFYEKVVLDDYDNNACNLLIDSKMKLSFILNKENNEDFDKEILDILIKLKIPSIKKKEEIISALEIMSNLIKKYSEIYLKTEKNTDKFLEKLNILLGLPIPTVTSGEAEIKYISGKYQDQYTILTNISKQKETNKDIIPLLLSIFNLLNINNMIFTYLDNLPAPNSAKYSYLDYILQLFLITEKETKEEFKVYDEMGKKNTLKELSILVNDICKKYNKNLGEADKNIIDNYLYFDEFNSDTVKDINEKVTLFEMIINYTVMKSKKKTDLACFNKLTYFKDVIKRVGYNNTLTSDGLPEYHLHCILIYCSSDLNITIDFKPYIYSKLEIKGKKNCHYLIYCMDNDNKEIKIDYNKINIEIKENEPLSLPPGNTDINGNVGMDECSINCPVCGTVNVLNETNTDFKCVFCEASLF